MVFKCFQFGVADLGHATIVTFALSTLGLELQLLHLLLVLLDLVDQLAFTLPLGTEFAFLIAQLSNFAVEGSEFSRDSGLSRVSGFATNALALNLELCKAAANLVELFRHRVTLHAEFGGSLVHEVDGLVGQETLGDITLRKLDGSNAGIVLDTHLMVVLVAFLQTS